MLRLTKGTWVLVADGQKALFLRNDGDAFSPDLAVMRLEEQDNPRMGEQASDRPGRMPDTGAGQRSAVEEADWHRLAKDRFAVEIADILLRLVRRRAFDRLVIVAPPRTLGAMRKALHSEVADCLVAEVARDLTNLPPERIAAQIVPVLEDMSG